MKVIDWKRKSSDEKSKQILSLGSQSRILKEIIPPNGVTFQTILPDYNISHSSKEPHGIPELYEMIDRLKAHEADGIRVWKINRLARNSVDAGIVIWAVQQGVKIFTPYKTFGVQEIGDLYREFEKAHIYVNELRENTTEGTKTKLEQGKAPIIAPIGYRNTPEKIQGLREILVDEERFPIVRRMWDLLLTGGYSVNKIWLIATKEWGLTMRNGKTLSRSQTYKIFTNIFYTGSYFMYDGILYKNGVHKPMITIDEFDLAQKILGRNGKPREVTREFSYTHWLQCICGSSTKAEVRIRKWCYACKAKFNAEKHDVCPKCGGELSDHTMIDIRYGCNRKKDPHCKQPSISLKELEKQIDAKLATFTLPQKYIDWTMEVLREQHAKESTQRQAIEKNQQNSIMFIKKKLDNLAFKYLSPENVNGEIFTDAEYKQLKQELENQLHGLESDERATTKRQEDWLNTAERVFVFARNARYWFEHGTKQQKRAIFQAIGSNPVLDNRILRFDLLKPFQVLQKMAILGKQENAWFEPQTQIVNTSKIPSLPSINLVQYPVPDSNRRLPG